MAFELLAQKRGRLAATDVTGALRAEEDDGGVGTRARAEWCEGFDAGGFLLVFFAVAAGFILRGL